jgi:hypothetical protein
VTAPESIRVDWLDTRSAFFRDRAAELWPSSPVASRFERRLREEYLDYCGRTAELISPSEFVDIAAANRERSLARYGLVVGGIIGAVTGFLIGGWIGAVALTAIGSVAAMYVGWGLGAIRAEVFLARVASVAADRAAYRAWTEQSAADKCRCGVRSSVHDADCPDLLID